MIHLDGVSVVVPASRRGDADRTLLADVTLTLTEHRIGIIGANGSGKSTLLRLLNGLRLPTAGTVTSGGFDTASQGRQVRTHVGFIFTDPLAQLVMSTPIEDVELSLRSRIKGRENRTREALRLLEERGLGKLAHQSIHDLSGGERQLVALTSVLAVEPKIIVADEPTTLLDLRNRLALRDTFARLPQQLIFSTHDMDVASDATRVLVVDGGRIVADGDPAAAIRFYERSMAMTP
ncbi:energy-coupling factor ABC transporter ATP-binding protein [Tessaracoccus antarcticus]|uniref:ABC transporter ATP-binding protein n=1 Tax=Tessaracoccus antarcticus TaxID=2479848 RepID=A0A3M0GDN9_9ACTN|nr:ABC transporter ATP-binding protein [Tessaracoccus antarcticus]RMB59713.1 ABC transporter ATP-binding protein [Tessaracoccus antarcticus]